MYTNEKDISLMFEIVTGEITDFVISHHIDAVVNAANPTLMGSDQGVDGSIHSAINKGFTDNTEFKDKIREEVDRGQCLEERSIRCGRGKTVVTSGYSLCRYVIHVVGPEYERMRWKRLSLCTSSCTRMLEACYKEIINTIKQYPGIKSVAIPIISSGNYGFPFALSLKIAIAAIGNALVSWKRQDPEFFNMAAIEKIYFCIYDTDEAEKNKKEKCARKYLERYKKIFAKDKKVVYQNSVTGHLRYLSDIVIHDADRGYFMVARMTRLFLVCIRILFFPIFLFKDVPAGCNWQRRRGAVEFITLLKATVPFIIYIIFCHWQFNERESFIVQGIVLYLLADTVTYLLALIVLADIQRPSANVIRSLILLFINYIEVSMEISILFYLQNYPVVKFSEAVKFGILSEELNQCLESATNAFLYYMNAGIKFFFLTLAFGYFANHLKQREFIS